MAYLLSFALATCALVHTILYHGRSVINGMKRIRVEPDDIHAKLMRNYPEVPDWWYIVSFVFFFLMMVLVVEVRTSVVTLPVCSLFPLSGMAYFHACLGSVLGRTLATIIHVTIWFHLCNDRPRGNIFLLDTT